MTQYNVVLVDYDDDLFSPLGWEAEMLSTVGAEWQYGQYRQTDDIKRVTQNADVVMVQSVRPLLSESVIRGMDRCRCIIRLGIGYDSVDVKTATEMGILVCNVPLYCVDDVAEHALGLLLDGVRHLALQDRWIRQGKWDRRGARPAHRITGSVLGLVSFGRIARALAKRAKGLGMTVLAFDPYVNADDMSDMDVQKVELEELLGQSDFISVHTPLTDSTFHLLDKREFDMIKLGAVLVNTSRGGIVSSEALITAMCKGTVAAAGLDVMEDEPLPADSPLRRFENITFTPHVGACTEESTADLYRVACQIACDVLRNVAPASVVNPEVKSRFNVQS